MSTPLQDTPVPVRQRLSAAWGALMFCYLYGDYFGLYTPDKLKGMLAGEGPVGAYSEGSLVGVSLMMAVPALMVLGALLLPARLCRWLNVLLGIAYTAIMLLTLPGARPYYLVLGGIEIVLSLSIAVIALRWPRTKA